MSNHPNDNQPRSAELLAKLSRLGDDDGQGLDGYWKWAFCEGWNAARAARTEPVAPEVSARTSVVTDEQIESMASACGLYGARKAVVQCFRELLASTPTPVVDSGLAVAERCARFAELYRDEHAQCRTAEEACNEIADACRQYAAAKPVSVDAGSGMQWEMAVGDWKEELVALHGPEGHIASGLTVEQARAIINAHGGVGKLPAAARATPPNESTGEPK